MTSLAYQKRNEVRLQAAITSIVEHEDVFGKFCTVHSTSEKIGVYSVDVENLHAVSCTCPGNAEHGYDCIHMVATDCYLRDRRPSFYEGIRKLEKPAPIVETPQTDGTIEVETVHEDGTRKQVATIRRVQPAPVETVPVVEVMEAAQAEMHILSDTSFEYLGTQLRYIEEEQEDGTIITWSVKLDGTRKRIAQTWPLKKSPEQIAAEAEVKAEAKLAAFRAGMEEQYASDPRVTRYDEAAENRSAYLKMMESEY